MAHEHDHEHRHVHTQGEQHDHKPGGDRRHHDHTDLDWAVMGPLLETQAELFSPLYERAMAWLAKERTDPGLIVDVGSGPGVVACLFAETFPGARVVAVDGSEPLLERARARADRQGFGDRFSTLTGELPQVLGQLEYPADLLWASRSLHHLGDQRGGLAAFAERLAPGGTLAIMEGGLPSRFLPRDFGIGRPGLEARIDAIESEWFAQMRADLPGAVTETEDWPALLTSVGLKHTGSRSFLLDLPAPAPDRVRAYVATWLTRVRDTYGEAMDAEDRAALDRLVDPQDPASVHRRADVFVLAAHTVHTAVRTS
ncbi:methyltransferase domain-containing protein [Streptomyces sp. NBC_01261]|uniref:class I SAM-dependent methyltransferase n=1 Tax=Streptomyces sp. NBC_01261 TaxID=2903802 RepID=UPI002E3754F3|nr:methyltransferase [Streptomyces sp. NBC_01261]